MRFAILALLLAALPAGAADYTFAAAQDGTFHVQPADKDTDGDPVSAGFYSYCDVGIAWGAGKTATARINAPAPGAVVAVTFKDAKGPGTGIAFCANSSGTVGGSATADITFRLGVPGKPGLSQ